MDGKLGLVSDGPRRSLPAWAQERYLNQRVTEPETATQEHRHASHTPSKTDLEQGCTPTGEEHDQEEVTAANRR
jgi:hypothetical protein